MSSAYVGTLRRPKVTTPKRPPSVQAVRAAASVMPTTGMGSNSRSAASPVSIDTAISTASQPDAWVAASSSMPCCASAFSLRLPITCGPKVPVTPITSVPGPATSRAAVTQPSVMA